MNTTSHFTLIGILLPQADACATPSTQLGHNYSVSVEPPNVVSPLVNRWQQQSADDTNSVGLAALRMISTGKREQQLFKLRGHLCKHGLKN